MMANEDRPREHRYTLRAVRGDGDGGRRRDRGGAPDARHDLHGGGAERSSAL